MRKTLALIAILAFDTDSTTSAAVFDDRAKKLSDYFTVLKQQQYQEACLHRKFRGCGEEHDGTSLEPGARSSEARLIKHEGRKPKGRRLLDEKTQALTEGQPESRDAVAVAPHDSRTMVLVPAGEFFMGSSTGEADERPERRVYLDAFLMDQNETTVEQYATFLEATSHKAPPEWPIMSRPMHQRRPVVNVDWADAEAYCKWAGKRLPTEAEWEKAARGTDGRIYPWGHESPTTVHANLRKDAWSNHYVLSTVGSYENGKSPYGLYDMAGNVWEWVNDWYDSEYYKTAPLRNPTGPAPGKSKVVRGGSWGSGPDGLRSAERETHVPSFKGYGTGFRCAKTP
jgi:formylglycine-generating enzyme required for sulfatase activity